MSEFKKDTLVAFVVPGDGHPEVLMNDHWQVAVPAMLKNLSQDEREWVAFGSVKTEFVDLDSELYVGRVLKFSVEGRYRA